MKKMVLSAALAAAAEGFAAEKSKALSIDGLEFTFEVKFMTVGAKNPVTTVSSSNMWAKTVTTAGDRTTAVWKGSDFAGSDFTVTMTVDRGPDGDRCWRLDAKGAACREDVLEIWPYFAKKMTVGRSSMLSMQSQGSICPWRPDKFKVGEPFLWSSFQMCRFDAFLEKDADSVYFDVPPHSNVSFVNGFIRSGEDEASFYYKAMPQIGEGSGFRHGEAGIHGSWRLFRGGWYEAARIYRTRPHVIAKTAAAKKRGTTKALRDVGLWMWNRGSSENVLPPAVQFQKDAGVPAAVDWYWWHAIPYDSSYPNFWPPREGVEKFRETVKKAKAAGVFIQVYVNGQAWDMDDPTFKAQGGEEEVFRHADGTFTGIAFNRYDGHRLSYACGDMPKFKAMHLKLLANLHDSGLDGQYLDQVGCALHQPCYAANHGHPVGASTMPGYRRQLAEYKRKFPDWPLCTEDLTEEFMDVFDNIICLAPSNERLGWCHEFTEMVPAWAAVYHGCINVFGNYDMIDHVPPFDPKWPDKDRWTEEKDWVSMFPDQFAVELARGVIWGMQPSVHNFRLEHTRDPHLARDYRFMTDTAKFYYANREFLYDGTMLAPGEMECERREVEFTRRMIYTKNGEYKVNRSVNPAVMHSCWQAPDGRKAAILVNWSLRPQKYRLVTPDLGVLEGELPARSWGRR